MTGGPEASRQPAPAPNIVMGRADGGLLAENILHFARVLRGAGLPVGPGRVIDALEAVGTVGVSSRRDFYWTLHAVFVTRRDQRDVFDQAFHMFWRDPDLLNRMLAMLLPTMRSEEAKGPDPALLPRVAEALARDHKPPPTPPGSDEETEIEVDATLTWSETEVLAAKDFEQMTGAEFEDAKRAARALTLPVEAVRTRRYRVDPRGRKPDPRATLRASARRGGEWEPLHFRKPRLRRPPLVVLCDISGSMERYARVLLHFLVGVAGERERMHTFLFGTRLTNITRHLRHKDPDRAVAQASAAADDWSGGTRIGGCLHAFNREWSRRVLGQGAVVLLITDGLDRDGSEVLDAEVARLARSSRSLVWLNPLLRFDGYAPKARGARALVSHVDGLLPVHNLASLADLARALERGFGGDRSGLSRAMATWRRRAMDP